MTATWIFQMGEWRDGGGATCGVPAGRWTGSCEQDGPTCHKASRTEGEETNAMLRATVVLREGGWEAKARRLARVLNPVAVSPAAPRETLAALDAWGPSLMPRSARVRGVTMGLGILGAAGDQRCGRAAHQDAGGGRRTPASTAGGLGGDRSRRGGPGGGAGAALPQAVGGVGAVHRPAAAGWGRRRGRP